MADQDIPAGLFNDPVPAARNLQSLFSAFITAGSLYPVDEFAASLKSHLEVAPDPDLAVMHLLRFSEVALSKASLFNDLLHYPVVMDLLIRLFGSSRHFADILVREPGLFRWLAAPEVLSVPVTRRYLDRQIARIEEMFERPDRKMDALKRLQRRELLRIGARDMLQKASLAETTEQLSLLADSLIDATLRIVTAQGVVSGGTLPRTPCAVIGLGKLGGGELNYSSDIDLVVVYGEDGEVRKGRRVAATHLEYFHRLTEKLVRALSHPTAEGYLYRVDMRLRPEAGAGPLARSVQGYLSYYESRGEIWERQMLLKARPVAGDAHLGSRFIRALEPFVYPRTFFHHPAESVARIKARIEKAIGNEANVKLMPGGIRDIEFIVQTLQLINGGKMHSIRQAGTLRALAALRDAGLLSHAETEVLADAYVFYRTVEHRLQTRLNTQTHTLPSDRVLVTSLARQTGFLSSEDFLARLASHRQAVRAIFDQVLATPGVDDGRQGLLALVEGGATEERISSVFSAHGFRNHRQVMKNLRVLTSGTALTDVRAIDARGREAFTAIAPDLFADIARTPDPDLTLNNLTAMASAQKFPGQMYALFREKGFRNLVLQICSVSPRFARALASSPLLLESLATSVRDLAERPTPVHQEPRDLTAFKSEEELRAGIRHVLGFITLEQLARELAAIADLAVSTLFRRASRKAKLPSPPLALFALGKYGSREMLYGADLDIIAVSTRTIAPLRTRMEKLATTLVGGLTAVGPAGQLYDVDMRLRPEGRNAPLVVDLDAYQSYLSGRASFWERQSLTRIRPVCGDASLTEDVLSAVETFVYHAPLPADWVASTVAMRRKMESRSRFHGKGLQDIKLGPGGMVDIEFLAQMIQLHFGREHPVFRRQDVPGVLALAKDAFLTPDEAMTLLSGYRLYRSLENMLRITLEERGSLLPGGDKLELLARCLDRTDGARLTSRIEATMTHIRSLFLTITSRLVKT
jgi:glutamate-ammonia-ligase adenylyltransferase